MQEEEENEETEDEHVPSDSDTSTDGEDTAAGGFMAYGVYCCTYRA